MFHKDPEINKVRRNPINKMYLHKSELCLDIEKLMKMAEDDDAVVDKCREALGELNLFKDGSVKKYIRDKHCVVEAFILGFKMKKQPPTFVIDYIYTFLVNELLVSDDIREIVEVISKNSGWCDTSKMKILQMSYYFIRYEEFRGEIALSLFKTVIKLVEDKNKQIQTTAKPIAMHLVDFAFNKACVNHKSTLCFNSEGEESNVEEVKVLRSEELPRKKGFETPRLIDDGILLLRYLLSKVGSSKETTCFVIEIIVLITQKDDLFEYQEFRKIYSADVIDILVGEVRKGNSARGSVYKILPELAKKHFDLLETQIRKIFDEVEKSYKSLDEAEMQIFLEFFENIDLALFNPYGAIIRRIFFRILDEVSFENEASNESGIVCIERSLRNQMKEQEDAGGRVHPSGKVFFDKFSGSFYTKLSGTKEVHPGVESLLGMVLDFYAAVGGKESLDKFLSMAFRLKFSEMACKSAVKNRKHIQDSWDVILRDGKDHVKLVIESISSFDAEELFFLTKAIGTMKTEEKEVLDRGTWTPKEKIDLCQCIFSVVKPVVVEPLNIKIFEIILIGILKESEKDGDYATRVFCSVLVDYFGQIEVLSPDIENVTFTLLQKMVVKNLDKNGAEILEALFEILRLVTPDGGWNHIMQCIECACIPSLYSSLFPVIRWIVEEFNGQITEEHFKVIISCLHSMCLSENDEISLKSIFIFQDIGECLISRKIISHVPDKESKAGDGKGIGITWTRYLDALGQILDDKRVIIRETAIKYLFAFIEAELGVMNSNEWDYVSKSSLIPLFEKNKKLMMSSDVEDVNASILVLRESNGIIGKACYHKELFSSFLDLVEYGIHNSSSCEVQNLCLEGLKIVTKKVSEAALELGEDAGGSNEGSLGHGIADGNADGDSSVEADRSGKDGDKSLNADGHGEGKSMCDSTTAKESLLYSSRGSIFENVGFKTRMSEKPLILPVGLREQVLDTYKSILINVPITSAYPIFIYLDLIDLFRTFPFKSSEVSSFIPLFHRFIHISDRSLQEKVLELTESLGSLDNMCDVLVEAYSSWMDPLDMHLTHLLMSKIGKVLSRNGSTGKYSEILQRLIEYSRLPNFWESSIEAFMKSSESIATRSSFVSFVNGSRTILEESYKMLDSSLMRNENVKSEDVGSESMLDETRISISSDEPAKNLAGLLRRRERMILEFLSFYHGIILRFRGVSTQVQNHDSQPFDQTTDLEIKDAYKVVFELSELDAGLRKENISLKCYTILFHDLNVVYDDVVPKIRAVLTNYNEIEAIYNGLCSRSKQRETYAILDGICRSGDKRLINDIKDLLVESLRSKDYRIIDYVRRCLKVILVP